MAVLAVALTSMLAAPGAGAQPAQDSVTGTLVDSPFRPLTWTINASSGPSGENPTGTLEARGLLNATFPVTCLQVTGNRAVIGGRLTSGPTTVQVFVVVVDEPGELQDRILREFFVNDPLAPATCAEFDARTGAPTPFPAFSGSVVVIDAQPFPTSKEQCKDGGWRRFGDTFKNQGDCVSFVATGGRSAPPGNQPSSSQ
jgi:hypothetical protein